MDLFLIGAPAIDACNGLLAVIRLIYTVLKIFWILIPIGLIVFGTIDLGKAVIASDEKEVKAAQKRLISRFIYAALVFFVPIIVVAIMNVISQSGTGADTQTWYDCWTAVVDG